MASGTHESVRSPSLVNPLAASNEPAAWAAATMSLVRRVWGGKTALDEIGGPPRGGGGRGGGPPPGRRPPGGPPWPPRAPPFCGGGGPRGPGLAPPDQRPD